MLRQRGFSLPFDPRFTQKFRILEEESQYVALHTPERGPLGMAETTKTSKAPAKPRKTAAKKAAPNGKTATVAEGGATIGTTNQVDPGQAKPVNLSREEIAKLAHQYYIDRGRQHGRHEEDWYRAEQELKHRHAS